MKKFLSKLFNHYDEDDNQQEFYRGSSLGLNDYTKLCQSIIINISTLTKMNEEKNWDNVIDYIALKTPLKWHNIESIIDMHYPDQFDPIDVLTVIKYVAEYFNTTTDYILGLTDKPY